MNVVAVFSFYGSNASIVFVGSFSFSQFRRYAITLFARIENERETYWIENKHTNSIENADAVLICNSNGYFGDTTIYEIGYAMACNKMIVLMDFGKTDFDMNFPRNYGLL